MTATLPKAGTVWVNGVERPLGTEGLIGLLRDLGIDPAARGIAVALNGAVAPRADWATTTLRDGDSVEVVKLFAGG